MPVTRKDTRQKEGVVPVRKGERRQDPLPLPQAQAPTLALALALTTPTHQPSHRRQLASVMHGHSASCHHKLCKCCQYMSNRRSITDRKGRVHQTPPNTNCNTRSVIYLLECRRCPGTFYVGQTSRPLRQRIAGHRAAMGQKRLPVYQHYGAANHSLSDAAVTILELCDQSSLDDRESDWIRRLECWYPNGLNYQDHNLGTQRSPTTPPHTASSSAPPKATPPTVTTPPVMATPQTTPPTVTTPPVVATPQTTPTSRPSAAPPTTNPGLITGEGDTPMGLAHAITLALALALDLAQLTNICLAYPKV